MSHSSVVSNHPDARHRQLVHAAAAGKEPLLWTLLSETTWNNRADTDALRQALQRAAAKGSISMVRMLLDSGADANRSPSRGNETAALIRAAENGHAEVVTALLNAGADPGARDKSERTALFWAAARGYVEVVRVLLDGRAEVNTRDAEGRTVVVSLAADRLFAWSPTVLKALMKTNVDLDVLDKDGRTALIWAVCLGKKEMVEILVEGQNRANIETCVDASHFVLTNYH